MTGAMQFSRLSLDFRSSRDDWSRALYGTVEDLIWMRYRKESPEKSLGLRPKSWQDTAGILFCIAR
jgi:hypothetical protein